MLIGNLSRHCCTTYLVISKNTVCSCGPPKAQHFSTKLCQSVSLICFGNDLCTYIFQSQQPEQFTPGPGVFLRSEFPGVYLEILILRSAQMKPLTAYVSYRQFHLLQLICNTYQVSVQTRQLNQVVTSYNGNTPLLLNDVFAWLGIHEGTFSNKKTLLQAVHTSLVHLQHAVDQGIASPPLLVLHELWYPYLLSGSQLLNVPQNRWTLSVTWRILDLPDQLEGLQANLRAVMTWLQ